MVGDPSHGLSLPELEPQIGPYLNILALRDRLTGGDTLAAVLQIGAADAAGPMRRLPLAGRATGACLESRAPWDHPGTTRG